MCAGEQFEAVQRGNGSPLRRAAIVSAAAMSTAGGVISLRSNLRTQSSSFRRSEELRSESELAAATRPGAWRAPVTAAAAAAARSGQRFLRSTAFSSTFAVTIETPQQEAAARTSRQHPILRRLVPQQQWEGSSLTSHLPTQSTFLYHYHDNEASNL